MKNTRMSKLARRRLKNPKAVRLAALKSYRALMLAHEILPRLQDIDYWQREADADKARRTVANANIDETCQQSAAIREIARRALRGETF